MDFKKQIKDICSSAREAGFELSGLGAGIKNKVLKNMAAELLKHKDIIIKANKKDIAAAVNSGKNSAFIDRLRLDEKRIKAMSESIRQISMLEDPCGKIIKSFKTSSGLMVNKMRVPIGVIGIIYESRPNVTSDCAALCFKSGNAVILKGGKESINSNMAIAKILKTSLGRFNINSSAIRLIELTQRKPTQALLKMDSYVDLIIPRGGESLIKAVVNDSKIPVIKHYKGICHIYVDRYANLKKAYNICFNAKVQRPGVCNAMEIMLVDEKIAKKFLPLMCKNFIDAGVEIRGCAKTLKILKNIVKIKKAVKKDFDTEFLDLKLAVLVVNGLDEAIRHVNIYSSKHSDAIVTENQNNALKFLKEVDSACVYSNASTRFTDGHEFGMGAEIGISTDKIHARGPMALEELTTYKYIIFGDGQVRK